MTEKKSRFVSYQLITDLFASLIFAFTVLTFVRMAVLYEGVIDLSYLHLLSVIILTEIFVFVRRLRIRLFPMILLHILPIAVYLCIMFVILMQQGRRGIVSSLVYLGFMALVNLIYSMFWRFRVTSVSAVTYDVFVASMALHLILFIISRGSLRQVVMLDALLIVCAYLVARQLYIFDDKYYHNTQSNTQPSKQVKQQNYLTIFFIAGGILLALLILNAVPVGSMLSVLRALANGIGKLLRRILPKEGKSKPNEPMEFPEPDSESGEEPLFVQILLVIFAVAIALVFLFLLFKGFYLFLKKFRAATPSNPSKVADDAVVDIIEEVFEEEEPLFSPKDFGEGYEGAVRKKYYKTVQKAIQSGTRIDPSYTPEQIESALKEKGDSSISDLTSEYKSVRYGKKKE